MGLNFLNTSFVISLAGKNTGSVPALPEVVFIGRSNVGKSSLINALTEKKSMAYTSKKPGYTKLLNYFLVDSTFYLVDAPGYGYARTGMKQKAVFQAMMDDYFTNNPALKMIYLLLDSRRTVSPDDLEFIDFAMHYNLPLTYVFTKSDKLNQKGRSLADKVYQALPNAYLTKPFFTSSLTKKEIKSLQEAIALVIETDNSAKN